VTLPGIVALSERVELPSSSGRGAARVSVAITRISNASGESMIWRCVVGIKVL
jgi:hypothetical protein